jgi:NADH-quinone oxidoreductase subunit M
VASKVALFFGLSVLGCSIILLNHFIWVKTLAFYNGSTNLMFSLPLKADGLTSYAIDNGIDLIIYTSFELNKNAKAFYSQLVFMSFAMKKTFLSCRRTYIISSGIIFNSIYFIALIWGNGD